ncbi:MAG: twin-arginine translocation signal domain-containing protein, partial [Flavobacteriaceae bacterium]
MGSQKSNQKNSRRDFLKKSAVASSVFILPRHVLGGTGFTAPSDQMNIAAIGAGGKGRSDLVNAT